MAVPKQRQSKMRRDTRRAQHDKIDAPNLGRCPSCSEPRLPHRACPACGYYGGNKNREGVTYESLVVGK